MTKVEKLKKKIACIYNGLIGPIPEPDKWLFVVGCYNSGTTLLHKLLSKHPSIASMPNEGQSLTDQLIEPRESGLPRLWAIEPELFCMDEDTDDRVNLRKLKKQWGAMLNDPNRPIVIDKSPVNAARTRWLQKKFNHAYFIGIVRNGWAVSEGIHRKVGHSLDLTAKQWARSNEIMLRDFEYLKHKVLVRYEELTAKPAALLNEIFNFLGIESIELKELGGTWSIHEQNAPIKNMNYRSFEALSAQDIAVIEENAGDMLSKLGYVCELKP